MKIQHSRRAGFTLVEIMIVTTIIGLFVSIAVPNFIIARSNAQRNTCINNLRQIDTAKQQWAFESSTGVNSTPSTTQIETYLGRGTGSVANVFCPMDATRTIGNSYVIGDLRTAPQCNMQPGKHILSQ